LSCSSSSLLLNGVLLALDVHQVFRGSLQHIADLVEFVVISQLLHVPYALCLFATGKLHLKMFARSLMPPWLLLAGNLNVETTLVDSLLLAGETGDSEHTQHLHINYSQPGQLCVCVCLCLRVCV
jgi:hypothetical protein